MVFVIPVKLILPLAIVTLSDISADFIDSGYRDE
jgi:hypothetical protein